MLTLSCVLSICEVNCVNDKTEQSNAKNNKQGDNCTPFCSCSCSHPIVFNLKPILPEKKLPGFAKKLSFAFADQHFKSYNCHNIWQPPKLS